MLGLLRSMCLALSTLSSSLISFAPPARLIYQFPPGTFVENIACRPNSHLLLSVITSPILYTLDPTEPTPSPRIVYTFPNVTGMTGVAETNTPDVFAIIAGNWSTTDFSGVLGSFSIWRIDLRSDPPIVNMIAPIPDTSGLNGLAVVQSPSDTILMADSSRGAVWALNPQTRKASVAIQDAMFEPNSTFPLGINGINTRKATRGNQHTLHFVNSARGIYGTMPITSNGSPTGKATQLASLAIPERYDDFAIDEQGAALIAAHPNVVYKVSLEGVTTLFSKSPLIQEPTSSIFGRGSRKEQATLYLSTGGRYPGGGQILAIDDYAALRKAAVSEEVTSSRWPSGQQVLSRRRGGSVLA